MIRACLATLAVAVVSSLAVPEVTAQEQPRKEPANPRQHMMKATDEQSTIRHLVVYQEIFHSVHGRYSSSADSLRIDVPKGVTLTIRTTEGGFAGVARSGSRECAIFRGTAPRPRPFAEKPDAVFCMPPVDTSRKRHRDE